MNRVREVTCAPIRTPNGRLTGAVAVVRDITDRKRAEEAITQSQKTFAELIERAPFGIYMVDSQFRIAR